MRAAWFAALLSAPLLCPGTASAHQCLNVVFSLDTLCAGRVEHRSCFTDLNACVADTLTRDSLLSVLLREYRVKTYAALGLVDSVRTLYYTDTLWVDSEAILIPMQVESAWVSLKHPLKGNFPETSLVFRNRWSYFPPDTISYAPLTDTPFIAFFNSAADMASLGLGPTRDCLLEPTVFALKDVGIVRKGSGVRLPGVSMPLRLFLERAGNPDPVWRQYPARGDVREAVIRYRNTTVSLGDLIPPSKVEAFTIRGRRIGRWSTESDGPWTFPAPEAGSWAILKTNGEDRGRRLLLLPGNAWAETGTGGNGCTDGLR